MEYKCKLCPLRFYEENEIISHCSKHKADNPVRARGGSLDAFILKQARKPFQVRSAPYTCRPSGMINTINIDTFVHLSKYLESQFSVKVEELLPLKRKRSPSNEMRKHPRITPKVVPAPTNPTVVPLLSLDLPTPLPASASANVKSPSIPPSVPAPNIHPLSHRKRENINKNAKRYKCNKCPLSSTDIQVMEDHTFNVHDLKDIVVICKLCNCHFTSGSALQSHALTKHRGRTDEVDELSPLIVETRIISYRSIPFCKVCKYSHFQLFDKMLGCFCSNRIPTPGKLEDFSSIPTHLPPSIGVHSFNSIKPIPDEYHCIKTGYPFRPGPPKDSNSVNKITQNFKELSTISPSIPPPEKPIVFPKFSKNSVEKSTVMPKIKKVKKNAEAKSSRAKDSEDPLPPL